MIRGNGEAQCGLDISLTFAAAQPPNCSFPDAPASRFTGHEQGSRLAQCGLMADNRCAALAIRPACRLEQGLWRSAGRDAGLKATGWPDGEGCTPIVGH